MEVITVNSLDTLETTNYKVLKQGDTYALFLEVSNGYELNVNEDMKLNIIVNENVETSLMINVAKGVKQSYVNVVVEKNAVARVFVLNEANNTSINEEHTIKENGHLYIAYGDLENGVNKHSSKYILSGQEANLEVKMAYINDGDDAKKLDIYVDHVVGNTSSNVEVYGVMKQNSKFLADVTSHIVNGAHGSKAHQASRILNFDSNVNANVSPILLIDENDVQASHACSMGTVDENHLFYLESRGLSPKDAVSLIVSGYLSVLSTVFDDEELIEKVNSVILEKAGA